MMLSEFRSGKAGSVSSLPSGCLLKFQLYVLIKLNKKLMVKKRSLHRDASSHDGGGEKRDLGNTGDSLNFSVNSLKTKRRTEKYLRSRVRENKYK